MNLYLITGSMVAGALVYAIAGYVFDVWTFLNIKKNKKFDSLRDKAIRFGIDPDLDIQMGAFIAGYEVGKLDAGSGET